MKKKQQTDVSK